MRKSGIRVQDPRACRCRCYPEVATRVHPEYSRTLAYTRTHTYTRTRARARARLSIAGRASLGMQHPHPRVGCSSQPGCYYRRTATTSSARPTSSTIAYIHRRRYIPRHPPWHRTHPRLFISVCRAGFATVFSFSP